MKMIRIIISLNLLAILLVNSCKNSLDDIYIISNEDSLNKILYTNKNGIVLTPPEVKYAPYTFVIDSNNNFYFYSMPEERPGIFNDDDEPDYIDLRPNHIFSIPKGSEQSFFEKNVLNQKSSRNIKAIMIGSYKDTIDSKFLKDLIKLSKIKEKKIAVSIRLALPEERKVIKIKLNGLYYEPKL